MIDWLVTCYRTHALPHYFIREQSLIGHLTEDLLEDVARWLEMVKEQLCDLLLSSIGPDEHIKGIMEGVKDKVTRSTIRPPRACTDIQAYTEFITNLALAGSVETIEPGSDVYMQEYWYWMGKRSDVNLHSVLHESIQEQIIKNSALSTIVSLPETVLLPLLSPTWTLWSRNDAWICTDQYYTGFSAMCTTVCMYTTSTGRVRPDGLQRSATRKPSTTTQRDWRWSTQMAGVTGDWEVMSGWPHSTTSVVRQTSWKKP